MTYRCVMVCTDLNQISDERLSSLTGFLRSLRNCRREWANRLANTRVYAEQWMRRGILVVAIALIAASCNGSGGNDRTRPPASSEKRTLPSAARPGTYNVAELTETFVDTSRPTQGPGGQGNAPTRTLVTVIRYPESDGPFPLIVLAHGQTGNPSKFSQLTTAWASAGFVVAAPVFPLTSNQATFETIGDYANQPADMTFVIDQILALSKHRHGPLAGRVDGSHIGVAGLSLGGATVYGISFHSCCRDRRVGAALVMAGYLLPYDGTYEFPSVPLLIIHGNADSRGRDPYGMAKPPKFLLTLDRPTHSPPFEDTPDPADQLVVAVTVDFWHAYLYKQGAALDRLSTDAMVPGVQSFDQER
jgi:dienelactone hydrolase